jgi:M6 family metalloprotease-like protein
MPRTRLVVVVLLLSVLASAGLAVAQPGEPASAGKLSGTTGWTDEGQDTNYEIFLRPAGKIRAVMIFVDFPNHLAAEAPGDYRDTRSYYDFLVPGAVQWYKNSSYNAVDLQVTAVHKWYHMSQPDDFYGFLRGLTWEDHVRYVGEALALADSDVDFSKFDIFYIVPVRSASGITYSPTYIDDGPYYGMPTRAVLDGVNIRWGVTTGQDAWDSWGSKLLNHETGHIFGLPDLYAFAGKLVGEGNWVWHEAGWVWQEGNWVWEGGQWVWHPGQWLWQEAQWVWVWEGTPVLDFHYFVGGWDLMGLISGPAPDLLAWHKWKLGWVADDQVDVVTKAGTTEHHLTPIERNGSNKLLVVRTGQTTAYAVELRLPLVNDRSSADSGVLIYKVDSSVTSGEGPVRVIDASPNAPAGVHDLDTACFGTGAGKVRSFTDTAAGVTITVIKQSGENAFVRVEKVTDTIFER